MKYEKLKNNYYPEILDPSTQADWERICSLIEDDGVRQYDQIDEQIKDLIKCRNPKIKFETDDARFTDFVREYKGGRKDLELGCWVYYPWNQKLVHILLEEEFIEVRTNRNKYKITDEEQALLSTKKIGVIGLSVGQAVALTLIQERICGEIRLADFDDLELSNLNRIRTPLWNLGANKAENVAREIAEIDPFIKVIVYNKGLNDDNIHDFFTIGGKLDLLVEECDGLDIKILSRLKARELGIPVVMETNDRCMVDIERYDLDSSVEILHGLVKDMDTSILKNLKTNEEKMPYVLNLIGIGKTTSKLRASMLEIEQSIVTWPQLASSVTMGAGILSNYARAILLKQSVNSGRFYHDQWIPKNNNSHHQRSKLNPNEKVFEFKKIASELSSKNESVSIHKKDIRKIIKLSLNAPSAANNQPWRWIFKKKNLFLFHDSNRSRSYWDSEHHGAAISLGCALCNLKIASISMGYKPTIEVFQKNLGQTNIPVAEISFSNISQPADHHLLDMIGKRRTTRGNELSKPIKEKEYSELKSSIAEFGSVQLQFIKNPKQKNELGALLGELERIRLLDTNGHKDFVNEIRWHPSETMLKRNGVELQSLDLTISEKVGLEISKDPKVINHLINWDKGSAFNKLIKKGVESCHSIGILTIENKSEVNTINAGIAFQSLWLEATKIGIQFHPLATLPILFHGVERKSNYPDSASAKIVELKNQFEKQTGIREKVIMIFRVMRISQISSPSIRHKTNESYFETDA